MLLCFQDFDRDDYIGKEDLRLTVRAITANELTDEETEFVTDKVFNFILAYKACAIELSGWHRSKVSAVHNFQRWQQLGTELQVLT